MESKGNINSKKEVEEYCIKKEDEISADEDEDSILIKRTIACHALYPILVESHLNCLKLCLGDNEDIDHSVADDTKLNSSVANRPDLDQFMEAYCMTLNRLKEAIKEPQQESMAFIESMHSQLKELMEDPSSSALSP
ncbi:homeobox knotted-1-like 1 [Olea europaea subsp. europaea]|uniref:Homeobox knotted-1-like 1 n=1 Tax=Olea europaea subsp. europaea TaxID=158383 RepID=A0A8S0UJ51_OLEEU|nr:homeobox knotted-1-like 1 [Olea europaea subsp. europaea]